MIGSEVHDDKRREPRLRFELSVALSAGRRTWRLTTHDVSYRGMFVRLDDPPRPRELVRVDTALPEGGKLTLHGMITFVIPLGDEQGRPAGAGIQFFGSGGQEHHQWEAFVRKAWGEQSKHKRRRPTAHVSLVLRLRPRDTPELEDAITAALSQSGLPLEAGSEVPAGTRIPLEVVHPHTGETFDLAGVVRRHGDGLAVEIEGLAAERKALLSEFVSSGARSPRKR
jgi:hypothetical protein